MRLRLEGIAFGIFIPVYFVTTGMTFDLDSLLTRGGLALAALFLGLFVLTRGSSASSAKASAASGRAARPLRSDRAPADRGIVSIGKDRGIIGPSVGASLIGAGMLSVLIYPLVAIFLVRPLAAAPVDDRHDIARRRPSEDAPGN